MSGGSEWQIDEQQLAELNVVLQRAEDVLVYNCVTRSAQESKLFPVMPYLMNVMVETYYRYPEVIREALQHVTPEQIGDRSREVSTNYSSLLTLGHPELLPQRPRLADPHGDHPAAGQPRGSLDGHRLLAAFPAQLSPRTARG